MSNIVEGWVLPLLFIAVVTVGAVLAIIASISVDNIENNQAILREDELVRANRDLIIGYILYFVAVALVIVSIITHFSWHDAPAWLQSVLVLIAFVVVLVGVILIWIAYDNLRGIDDVSREQTLWALGLGLGGIVLGILLVFFRGSNYIREHTVKTVKETQEEQESPEVKGEDLESSTPITTQYSTPAQTRTTTTRSLEGDKKFPMMLS